MARRALPVFIFALLLVACTPDKRSNSSFFRPKSTPVLADGRGGMTVRVKLHAGEAVSVRAGEYTFAVGKTSRRGSGTFTFTEEGVLYPKGSFLLGGRRYSGALEGRRAHGEWLYINHVPIDEYLTSVVSHEMSPTWHREALKAQAVVARTYLLTKMKERTNQPYDVDATTNYQVYGGIKKNDSNARAAVAETHNEVLLYQGNLAETFFHSACGGTLASAREVWGKEIAYLNVQSSPYCATAPVYKWQITIPFSEIGRRLALRGVKNVSVAERSESKRVRALKITTAAGVKTVRADKFRVALGALKVKSTFFGVARKGNAVLLTGRGFGHGVGLCQWGTKVQAEERGMSYRRILDHYFPGTSLRTVSGQSV